MDDVSINGKQDAEDFIRTVQAMLDSPSNASEPASVAVSIAASVVAIEEPSPLLSVEINHLADLQRRQLANDSITESRHTLRIFLATTGHVPVHQIKATHARAFLDTIRWWPERATVRPQYRDLTVLEIIKVGKREQVPVPSPHTLNKHHQRLCAFLNSLVRLDQLNKNALSGLKSEIDTATDLDTGRLFTSD